MTAGTVNLRRTGAPSPAVAGRAAVAYILGGVATLAVASRVAPPSILLMVGSGAFVALGVWMFTSERYEHTLAVLMLYLGMADGYLKLRTGSSVMTLARDALLYAITLGAIARWIIRREPARFPPTTAWIVFFAGLDVVEVFNPGTGGIGHGLASLRPDLEFVPLFFFGYGVMRSRERLRGFLILLLVICAANGAASLVQFGETPAQFASWGPGYSQKVLGTGNVAGRTFTTSNGVAHVRPFGLQSDDGGGGDTGMLGVAAAIALLGPLRRRRWRETTFIALMAIGTILAIVTSQGRGAILASFATLLAYVGLSVVSRRLIPTLGGLIAGGLVTFLVISILAGSSSSGLFSRYDTITPSNVLGTAQASRGFSISEIPIYIAKYPFGAGLGQTGPAAGVGKTVSDFNGETEFTYLILEVGVIGTVLFVAYHIRLMIWSVLRIRRFEDPELRAMLAALAAPLFGIFANYFAGPASTTSPESPYLWFIAGAMVYWFTIGVRAERIRRRDGAVGPPTISCA